MPDQLQPQPGQMIPVAQPGLGGQMNPAIQPDVPGLMPPPMSIQLMLDERMQRLAVNIILDDYEAAERARRERDYGRDGKGVNRDFDAWRKQLMDMYMGQRLPKTIPWQFCSNRSLMIAMAIVEVLHARLFPAVYNEELTQWRPAKDVDAEKAERIEKMMFWWIRVRAKKREFFDRWVRYAIALGTVVSETQWDVQRLDKGKTTPQQTDPMGGPAQGGDKIIELFEKTRSDIIPIEDVYLIPGATDVQRDPFCIKKRFLYRDLEQMEQQGKAQNITKPTIPGGKCLKDYIVVANANTEGLDDVQAEEVKNIKRRNIEVEVLVWYGDADLDEDGYPEPLRLMCSRDWQLYLGGLQIKDISKRGMKHVDLTMYMPRLGEPQGLFGLGVLEQVKELADEIDAIFNQMTDANSLSVLRPGFYDPGGDLDAGALRIQPNKMTPVPNPSQNIYFPDVQIPTERLILAIRLCLEFIERLTAASSYIFGKESETVGGSGTATRTQAIVGAATQRFGIPAERLREGAARIMTMDLDLLQMNMPPGMEARILGDKGERIFGDNELSQEGISGEYDAYLLPDETLGSKDAERQLTQLLYSVLIQNPIVATDPTKIYNVTEPLIKAFGKSPENLLGPKPDMSAVAQPEDEHTLMIAGMFSQIKPAITQNQIEHVMKHQAFPQDPLFQSLPPILQAQVVQFLQAHIQEHMALMQQAAVMMQQAQKVQGGGSGGNKSGGVGGAPTVGSEPGVGSAQNPLAQAMQVKRSGESGGAPGQ